ncbi:hypothetical protein HK405_003142 [Cladochytrium tenue]|nr:hypothetical protein HK405_003142 [Cladochytrium tenue]
MVIDNPAGSSAATAAVSARRASTLRTRPHYRPAAIDNDGGGDGGSGQGEGYGGSNLASSDESGDDGDDADDPDTVSAALRARRPRPSLLLTGEDTLPSQPPRSTAPPRTGSLSGPARRASLAAMMSLTPMVLRRLNDRAAAAAATAGDVSGSAAAGAALRLLAPHDDDAASLLALGPPPPSSLPDYAETDAHEPQNSPPAFPLSASSTPPQPTPYPHPQHPQRHASLAAAWLPPPPPPLDASNAFSPAVPTNSSNNGGATSTWWRRLQHGLPRGASPFHYFPPARPKSDPSSPAVAAAATRNGHRRASPTHVFRRKGIYVQLSLIFGACLLALGVADCVNLLVLEVVPLGARWLAAILVRRPEGNWG